MPGGACSLPALARCEALDIYRMAASFASSDVRHGVGLAILMVGVSEMSYQMYFAHADKMATQDNIAALDTKALTEAPVPNCARDEGGSLGAGRQGQASMI